MITILKLRIGEPASFRSKLNSTLQDLSPPAQGHNSISKIKLPQEAGSSTTKRTSMESRRRASMRVITTPILRPKTTIVRQLTLSTTVGVMEAMTASRNLRMIKSRSCIRRRKRKQRRSMGASTSGKRIRRLHSSPSWRRARHSRMSSRTTKRGNPLKLSLSTSRRQLHSPALRMKSVFNDRLAWRPQMAAIKVSIRQRSIMNLRRMLMVVSTKRRSTTTISLSMSLKIDRALTIIVITIGMSISRTPTRERLEWSQRVQRAMVGVATIKVMGITITGRDIIEMQEIFIKRGISTSWVNLMKNTIKNITNKSSSPSSTMMKRSMKIGMRVALRSRNSKLLRSSNLNRITPIQLVEGQYSWTWSLRSLSLYLNHKRKNQIIILKQRISSLSLKLKNSGQLISHLIMHRTPISWDLALKTFNLPRNLSSPLIKNQFLLTSSRHSPTSSSHPTTAMPHKRRQFSTKHLLSQLGLLCQAKQLNSQLMSLLNAINSSNSYQSRQLLSTLESKMLTPNLLHQLSLTASMLHHQVSYLVAQSSDN